MVAFIEDVDGGLCLEMETKVIEQEWGLLEPFQHRKVLSKNDIRCWLYVEYLSDDEAPTQTYTDFWRATEVFPSTRP